MSSFSLSWRDSVVLVRWSFGCMHEVNPGHGPEQNGCFGSAITLETTHNNKPPLRCLHKLWSAHSGIVTQVITGSVKRGEYGAPLETLLWPLTNGQTIVNYVEDSPNDLTLAAMALGQGISPEFCTPFQYKDDVFPCQGITVIKITRSSDLLPILVR